MNSVPFLDPTSISPNTTELAIWGTAARSLPTPEAAPARPARVPAARPQPHHPQPRLKPGRPAPFPCRGHRPLRV